MLWDSGCFGGIKINIKQLCWCKQKKCISFALSLCNKIFVLLPMVSKICHKSSQEYTNAHLGTGWGSLFLYLFPSLYPPSSAYPQTATQSPLHLLKAEKRQLPQLLLFCHSSSRLPDNLAQSSFYWRAQTGQGTLLSPADNTVGLPGPRMSS